VSEDFFIFTERSEFIFRKTLTPELLIMNGSLLIQHVYLHLNADDAVLESIETFCDQNVDPDVTAKVAQYSMSRKHFAECEGKTLLVKSCHEIRIPSLNQDDRRLQQLPILHCAHLKSRNQRMRRHLLILLVVPFSTTQILKFFDDTNIEENDEENEITDERKNFNCLMLLVEILLQKRKVQLMMTICYNTNNINSVVTKSLY
jgi:hypothetical protein